MSKSLSLTLTAGHDNSLTINGSGFGPAASYRFEHSNRAKGPFVQETGVTFTTTATALTLVVPKALIDSFGTQEYYRIVLNSAVQYIGDLYINVLAKPTGATVNSWSDVPKPTNGIPVTDIDTSALILKSSLVISSSAPTNPAVGTVWINNSGVALGDTTAPSVPATPVASAGTNSVTVTTTGSTDNLAVTGYRWFRGGVQRGDTAGKTFTETGLTAGTPVTYTVLAYDAAGNVSAQSANSNSVTPTAAGVVGSNLDTVAGLVARYRADSATGSNGASVATLAPRAGSSFATLNQATVSAQPTLVSSAINGHPALRFTPGSSQYMEAGIGQGTQPFTVFSVFNLKNANGTVYSSADSASFAFLKASSAGDALAAGAGGTTSSAPWTTSTGWRITAVVFNGTNSRTYIHARTSTALSTNTGALATLRVARNASATAVYADVDLADQAVVAGAMTDTEIKAVLDDLAAYYALTLGA